MIAMKWGTLGILVDEVANRVAIVVRGWRAATEI